MSIIYHVCKYTPVELLTALGGSVGSLLGMYPFRHKTRHPKFTVGIPVIFVLQIGLLVWYFFLR